MEDRDTDDCDDRQHHGLQRNLELRVHPELPAGVEVLIEDSVHTGAAGHHTGPGQTDQAVDATSQSADALENDTHHPHRVEGRLAHGARGDQVQEQTTDDDVEQRHVESDVERRPHDDDHDHGDDRSQAHEPLEGDDVAALGVAAADVPERENRILDRAPLERQRREPGRDQEGHARPEELLGSSRRSGERSDENQNDPTHQETSTDAHAENTSRTDEKRTPGQTNTHHTDGEEHSIRGHPLLTLEQ